MRDWAGKDLKSVRSALCRQNWEWHVTFHFQLNTCKQIYSTAVNTCQGQSFSEWVQWWIMGLKCLAISFHEKTKLANYKLEFCVNKIKILLLECFYMRKHYISTGVVKNLSPFSSPSLRMLSICGFGGYKCDVVNSHRHRCYVNFSLKGLEPHRAHTRDLVTFRNHFRLNLQPGPMKTSDSLQ